MNGPTPRGACWEFLRPHVTRPRARAHGPRLLPPSPSPPRPPRPPAATAELRAALLGEATRRRPAYPLPLVTCRRERAGPGRGHTNATAVSWCARGGRRVTQAPPLCTDARWWEPGHGLGSNSASRFTVETCLPAPS